jgi:tetratricopeptide (TPR) repeat protein
LVLNITLSLSRLNQVFEARERMLGHGHADIGASLNNLANNLNAQGRYNEAGALYERALDARKQVRDLLERYMG